MQDPNQFDYQKLGTIAALLTAISAFVMAPFRFFLPRTAADKIYVKKVEEDGTRLYVHVKEWDEMKTRMDNSMEQGEKWQKLAQDWMNRP